MEWEKALLVIVGPILGLLGVAFSLSRNHYLGELARAKKENDERKSIAAGLYAELSVAEVIFLTHASALAAKSQTYDKLAECESTKNEKTNKNIMYYLPDFDRTIYANNASKIGMLGENVAFKVVTCYSHLALHKKLLSQRNISNNAELSSGANYALTLLMSGLDVIKKALEELRTITEGTK